MQLQEANEVTILGHDDGIRLPRGLEDLSIGGASEPKPSRRVRFHGELLGDPGSQGRGQLRVDPEDHAASIGWFSFFEANWRTEVMSSGSRSGSSSRTCWGVNPAASRSSTSVTRIRIPRIQGRPPHCSGLVVIRFMAPAYTSEAAGASQHSPPPRRGSRPSPVSSLRDASAKQRYLRKRNCVRSVAPAELELRVED